MHIRRTEFIIDKQFPIEVSHYWLNVRPPYNDKFNSVYRSIKGLMLKLQKREVDTKINLLY